MNGTTMSMGAPVTVGGRAAERSAFSKGKSTSETRRSEERREHPKESGFVKESDQKSIKQIKGEKASKEIIDSAKKDGVDSTLEKIAQGKFGDNTEDLRPKTEDRTQTTDDRLQTTEKKQQESGEKTEENKPKTEGGRKKAEDEQKFESPIEMQVNALRGRVESLSHENQQLQKRLAKVEEMNKTTMMTMYELAAALKKMVEEGEEDKKKKENMIGILAALMAKILTMILVDSNQIEKESEEDSSSPIVEKLVA